MNISDVAKITGLTSKAIRFYEEKGLVTPPMRSENGYRTYTQQHLNELTLLRQARQVGFNLEESGELVNLFNDPQRHSADVKRRVEHVLPSFSDFEAGRLTVGPDAIEVLLDIIGILLAESDPVNPFRLFFRDARIAAFLNDLAECELRLYPNDVFLGFHEFPDLREFQAGVTVNGDDLRVESSADVQENGAVLAP